MRGKSITTGSELRPLFQVVLTVCVSADEQLPNKLIFGRSVAIDTRTVLALIAQPAREQSASTPGEGHGGSFRSRLQ
jgi:hypothetical protein